MIKSIIRYINERKRTKAELQRLYDLDEVLTGINRAIMHAPDRNSLLGEICRLAVEEGGFDVAAVLNVPDDAGNRECLAWFGNASSATPVPRSDLPAAKPTERITGLEKKPCSSTMPKADNAGGRAMRAYAIRLHR